MEASECAAASLAMVLGAFGRFEPLEKLRIACGVSRDGTKATNLVKAARTYGLVCRAYRKEPAQLRALPLPQIAFWNFNHYLVVEGFGRKKVYLNDPVSGPRVVSQQEFDEAFTGVVFTFAKSPDFRKGGRKTSMLRALASRLPGTRASIAYLIAVSLGLALPGLVMPAFSRIFIDHILLEGRQAWIPPLIFAMAVAVAFRATLTWMQQKALLRIESKLAIGGAARFVWHILSLPMEFFSQRSAGDIAARVDINDRIASLLCGGLATNAINVLMAAFYAALMYRYDRVLAGASIVIAVVNLAILRFVSRVREDAWRRREQENGKLQGVSMAGLQMIETWKSTGSEGEFFSRWAGHHAKVLNAEQITGFSTLLLNMAPMLLTTLNSVAILWLGALRVIDGALTMGMLVAFQALVVLFLEPINGLLDVGGRLQQTVADMNRVDDVLRYPVPAASTPSALAGSAETEPDLNGHLELRGVTFGYSRLNEAPLISGFSLLLRPGRIVALAGISGSGKSTIAKLIAGLYEPWAGEILFDGRKRGDRGVHAMARSFAMVDQEIALFEGSIRDNIALWDEDVAEPTLVRAAEDASIHHDIAERTGGYRSRVDEGGRNFSGGQRQRLEIARALAGNPRILVLDEATSALDSSTEKLILDAVRKRGCTCLVIAHRLSAIRECDEIVILEGGRIVQRGTHAELIHAGGAYARLIGVS
jgi:NHLM bacteriocin system ABC transporter peptidase/ATP-binding protein